MNVLFNAWSNVGLGVAQQVRPADGTYTVIVTPACWTAMGCAMTAVGYRLPVGGAGAHAYLKAFCRHADQVGVGVNWKLRTTWTNDANDATQIPRDAILFP